MISKLDSAPKWLGSLPDKNKGTVWQVVKSLQANKRQGTVGVKTRSEVSLTKKKAYKQKKTGGARRGALSSPLCVGGGVAHGPKARDYRQSIPSGMNALALAISLSSRIKSGTVFSGSLEVASGKTKDAVHLIQTALPKVGKTIICLNNPQEATLRAYRNIRGVSLVPPEQLNTLDIVSSRALILSQEALAVLEKRLHSIQKQAIKS